jgi:glycosyltransferase involved in cell wall biosynthesis
MTKMAEVRQQQAISITADQNLARTKPRASTRIVFLTRSLDYGGAERQLVTLAKGLRKRGHRTVVAVFYRGGELEPDLQRAGVPVMVLDKRGRWDSLGFLWRLIRFVRREKPQVVHGYLIFPNVLAVLLRLVFPGIRAFWGLRDSVLDRSHYDWLERFLYRVERSLSRFADMIIVNSRAGFGYAVAHGFPREKLFVISNGIDTEYFRRDEEAGRELRVAWCVNNSEILIGLVGRLDRMKDHPTFLEAAAALARAHDDLRFVCVGDGPSGYKQELLRQSERLELTKRILWAGARRDMPAVYSALDINVSSSYGEGFPNVIGEAMACGVSCVVTDVGDSAWIVGDEGEVAPPKDARALEAAIERSIQRIKAGSYDTAYNRRRILDLFAVQSLVARSEVVLCSSTKTLRVV